MAKLYHCPVCGWKLAHVSGHHNPNCRRCGASLLEETGPAGRPAADAGPGARSGAGNLRTGLPTLVLIFCPLVGAVALGSIGYSGDPVTSVTVNGKTRPPTAAEQLPVKTANAGVGVCGGVLLGLAVGYGLRLLLRKG